MSRAFQELPMRRFPCRLQSAGQPPVRDEKRAASVLLGLRVCVGT